MTGKLQLTSILRGYRQPLEEDPNKKYYRDLITADRAKKRGSHIWVWLPVMGMICLIGVAASVWVWELRL